MVFGVWCSHDILHSLSGYNFATNYTFFSKTRERNLTTLKKPKVPVQTTKSGIVDLFNNQTKPTGKQQMYSHSVEG